MSRLRARFWSFAANGVLPKNCHSDCAKGGKRTFLALGTNGWDMVDCEITAVVASNAEADIVIRIAYT